MRVYVLLIIIALISFAGSAYLAYQNRVVTEQNIYSSTVPALWQLPIREIMLSYRVQGKVIKKDAQWTIENTDGRINVENVPNLEITKGKEITAEDALKWKKGATEEIQIGDELIMTYYLDQKNNKNYPASIFLIKK